MSKFTDKPIFGIDVAADFSIVAILSPNGDIYRKPFSFWNRKSGKEI